MITEILPKKSWAPVLPEFDQDGYNLITNIDIDIKVRGIVVFCHSSWTIQNFKCQGAFNEVIECKIVNE